MTLLPGPRTVAGIQGGAQKVFVKRMNDDDPLYPRSAAPQRGQSHPRPKKGPVPGTQPFLKGE